MHEPATDSTGPQEDPVLDLGTWIGRGQAFSLLSYHCSAAQAQCLARIRKEGLYKTLNLTWDEFCKRHLGASRARADETIRRLAEFGDAYFHLCEIVRISPHACREIQPAVKGEALEIGGDSIPITPDNAPRIRRAIGELRGELHDAREELARSNMGITNLQARLDTCFEEMSSLSARPLNACGRSALLGLVGYAMNKLKRLERMNSRK
jgi:hypothetical protein